MVWVLTYQLHIDYFKGSGEPFLSHLHVFKQYNIHGYTEPFLSHLHVFKQYNIYGYTKRVS